ncbi:MAG: carbohydrate-binding domain-containing protein [Clostridia bacterium]|nr:carbohydrate-binding domain-containing protein [Clostridia bacterium]
MKTKLFITAVITAIALTAVGCSVDYSGGGSFENPGDYLGGGGTGETADAVETTTEESAIISAGDFDTEALSGAIDHTVATEAVATDDGALVISQEGDYVLSGNYPYGVKITVAKNKTVHLYLNGANISCSDGKALYTDNKLADCTVTLVEGTTNTVTNGGNDVNAIHVKGNLSVNGSGKLVAISDSKSAIKASGALRIVDAEIEVSAANHGITALSVAAKDCKITVESAAKDGIQAETESKKFTLDDGFVSLVNVDYVASTDGDGIQADTFVYINGGTYNITTTGKFVSYSQKSEYELNDDDYRWQKSGSAYKRVALDDVRSPDGYFALAQGCKGIKAGEIEYTDDDDNEVTVTDGDYYIIIQNGTFDINSTDDCIHSNSGNVTVNGGTFALATSDNGISAEYLTKINGGDITITASFEGIEGGYVEINGGNIVLYATDDGINAASDDASVTEHIIITGGYVEVNAEGDGIDSNGNIQIDGGIVVVHGPTGSGNAALDSDKGILVNGGYLFAAGSLGMVETPSANSKQYVVSIATSNAVAADTSVSLKDSSGAELMSVTTRKQCQSIIMSCPEMEKDSEYTVYGGTSKIGSFTVSGIISTIGSTNSGRPGSSGAGGGFFGPGGRR